MHQDKNTNIFKKYLEHYYFGMMCNKVFGLQFSLFRYSDNLDILNILNNQDILDNLDHLDNLDILES